MNARVFLPILVLIASGCGKAEEIRRYRAPKEPTWRMLAAIAPGRGVVEHAGSDNGLPTSRNTAWTVGRHGDVARYRRPGSGVEALPSV